jgi:hypothetical protein
VGSTGLKMGPYLVDLGPRGAAAAANRGVQRRREGFDLGHSRLKRVGSAATDEPRRRWAKRRITCPQRGTGRNSRDLSA